MDHGVPLHAAHSTARGVTYAVLRAGDPDLASEVHDHGWWGSARRPWSVRPPQQCTETGEVVFEFASPVALFAKAFADGLSTMGAVDWGGTKLTVRGITTTDERWADRERRWRTVTPVVVKGPPPKRALLVPGEEGWATCLRASVTAAAAVLKVEAPTVLSVSGGRKVLVNVAGSRRMAATADVTVDLVGDPDALNRLADLGIGSRSTEGFGFVHSVRAES